MLSILACRVSTTARQLSAAACLLVLPALPATAEIFHSEAHGYSVEMPEGWTHIPVDVVAESAASIGLRGSPVTIDAAFQSTKPGAWFVYPYVTVQVLPYASAGLDRQIREDEFQSVLDAISGAAEGDQKASRGNVALTRPKLDLEGRSFSWILRLSAGNLGRVRGEVHGFFGRHALVQVMFYVRQSEWALYQSERRQVLGSFQFDPSHAFEKVTTPSGQTAPTEDTPVGESAAR